MKRALIAGRKIAAFDNELIQIIKGSEAPITQVKEEHLLIGIRNEERKVYRAIGVTNFNAYSKLLDKLEKFGLLEVPRYKGNCRGYDFVFEMQNEHHFKIQLG